MNLRKFTAFVISAFCLVCSAGGNVSSFAQESATGEETNVVGENNITELDCKKALALFKLKMSKKEMEDR